MCEGLVCFLLGRKRSVKLEILNKFKALPPPTIPLETESHVVQTSLELWSREWRMTLKF